MNDIIDDMYEITADMNANRYDIRRSKVVMVSTAGESTGMRARLT